mmetsp:Transcript_3584/g.11111  ORF Transcript_3584/g.11111 Transcript_3584/m.11111 type:complete len:361 (-) Transcript_3584:213-1295(-)
MGVWLRMPFPYGSEFAWDSTGHEEIATWLTRFGKLDEARQVKDAVTAYTSAVPHWAYCGSARRWWDFTINGATPRGNERVFHHYAAALNSVALYAHAFMQEPSNSWLWRLAACASGGSLTNVRSDGSASMGMHAGNDMLSRDDYSADFGVGFYGHWRNAGAYLVCGGADLGWLCLFCDLTRYSPASSTGLGGSDLGPGTAEVDCGARKGGEVRVVPRDAFGRRAYVQPMGILLVAEGARMTQIDVVWRGGGGQAAPASGSLSVRLIPAFSGATHALLSISGDGTYASQQRSASFRCEGEDEGAVKRVCLFAPVLLPHATGFVNVSLASGALTGQSIATVVKVEVQEQVTPLEGRGELRVT